MTDELARYRRILSRSFMAPYYRLQTSEFLNRYRTLNGKTYWLVLRSGSDRILEELAAKLRKKGGRTRITEGSLSRKYRSEADYSLWVYFPSGER